MKATTAIGIVVAIVGLALGATMEGSQLPAFLNVPAMVIIVCGTTGAVLAGNSMESMKAIPALYKKAIGGETPDLNERAQLLVSLAERARREGLLALDDQLSSIDDDFTRKGLQLVVDGTDADVVAEVLEIETEAMSSRHAARGTIFKEAGGFAPTIGIIGTVMGLVHVLENLSNPASLGPAISAAFIATFLGVASANLCYLPVANKLKELSTQEADARTMMIEGILSIQAGDNPRIVEEKLKTFLEPGERKHFEEEGGARDAGGLDAKAA
jgi:chemotaxis protein MotA